MFNTRMSMMDVNLQHGPLPAPRLQVHHNNLQRGKMKTIMISIELLKCIIFLKHKGNKYSSKQKCKQNDTA